MSDNSELTYQELAENFQRQNNPGMRDLFLMLAADAALKGGRAEEAERLRQQLLKLNPHHLLKPYASFAEAAAVPDIRGYLDELRQKYPVEEAEEMLETIVPLAPAPSDEAPPTLPPSPRPRPPAAPPAAPLGAEPRKADEPLKVYRVHPEIGETQPPRPPREPERPLPPPTRKLPVRPVAPGPIDETLPPQRQAAAPPPLEETMNPRAAPPRPARPPVQRPRPVPPPAPARRPVAPAPRPAEPTRPPPAPAEAEPEGLLAGGGAWVGVALFWLVLVVGLALGALTLLPEVFPEVLLPR